MEEELCAKCLIALTPETRISSCDEKANLIIVCKDKVKCEQRIQSAAHEEYMKTKRSQIEDNEKIRKEFGHLPKNEQLKAAYNLSMNDFVKEIKTRGGVVYYETSDGTRYVWSLFDNYWSKAIV